MYLLMYVAGVISATILWFICTLKNTKRRRKKVRNNTASKKISQEAPTFQKKQKVRIDTYCKAITAAVIGHGLAMITMSYILSWFSRDTVADVSVTLITEVVAPLCLYLGTNCVMNIFEKNELTFSKPIQMRKVREAWDKTYEDMEDAAE